MARKDNNYWLEQIANNGGGGGGGGGDASASNQVTGNTRLGDLTESAPASDTASSGLNGRLQRIAQRLTSLITATGATNDASATTDTGTFSLISLFKRALEKFTTMVTHLATIAGAVGSSGTRTGFAVTANTSAQTILAANSARLGGSIVNDSTARLYVKLGTDASATDFDYFLGPKVGENLWQMEIPEDWDGVITGIWSAANGAARGHERTA